MSRILDDHPDTVGEVSWRLQQPVLGHMTSAVAEPGSRRSRVGVGFEALDREMFDPERVYPHLAGLGVGWARVQTGWSRCEQTEGVYDFDWLDRIVDSLADQGIETMFSLTFGNRLYTAEAPHPSAVGFAPTSDARASEAWRAYVGALVRRFRDRVRTWEVWNEPNIPQFWRPGQENGAEYAALVAMTAEVVRAEHPQAVIVGGALSRADAMFLHEALGAGMADHIDALTFHPYQPVPEHNLRAMHDVLRRLLDAWSPPGSIEIWQGEAGCPSQADGHNDDWLGLYDVDEGVQAAWVTRRVLIDQQIGFGRSYYFHAVDLVAKPYRQSDGAERPPVLMGLIDGRSYEPKLSFHALGRVLTLIESGAERRDLLFMFAEVDQEDPVQTGMLAAPTAVSYARSGAPLLAYWLTEDPQQRRAPEQVALQLWWDADLRMDDPVLVDVVTGAVHEVRRAPLSDQLAYDAVLGERFVLPILDRPLILTDASVVPGYDHGPRTDAATGQLLGELRRLRYL